MTVRETIPEALRPEVDAALAWFNRQEDLSFEVTGIVDPEASLAQGDSRAIRLERSAGRSNPLLRKLVRWQGTGTTLSKVCDIFSTT